ncbi:MAG: CoA transferase [Rhodospirillaceae bacterium]|nr:CoA transferase [Rhodospirillaceae bacterium]|tara:strand:- start:2070 stop:3284 length:1215 start_codon:yes stop_codon:yes gene_type:complete
MTTPSLPLKGLKLITIEQYGAAPFGTMYLADLGAEVIKVENHHNGGEMGRHVVPYSKGDDSLFFQTFSCNKRGLALNLKLKKGQEVLHRLVANADALINNLRGDLPAKLGLDYATLGKIKPELVCVHLSAYGRNNERAAWPGLDYVMQAEAGYLSMTGEPDSPPTRMGLSIVDFMAGLTAALALVSGVMGARSSGKGQDYDASLFDVAMINLSYPAVWHLTEGFEPTRVSRSGHPSLVPSEMYRTEDGWIFIMANKANFWPRLCNALEKPEWINHPKMKDFQDRLDNREEVVSRLEKVFMTRTTSEWLQRLHGKLPCAPVNDVESALTGDFAASQKSIQSVEHSHWGEVKMVRQPILINGQVAPRRAAPALGADTADILLEAGYSEEEISALEVENVISLDHQD